MATSTPKTVEEQLTDLRSELDKIKLYITNSITGITTSVNSISTEVGGKLTADDLNAVTARINSIETSLEGRTRAIEDMEEEHNELSQYEDEIEDLLKEVRDVKDKTTSGLAKLSETINNYQGNLGTKVGEVLETLGINNELKNSINNALNSANAMKEEVLGVIYTKHPELNITVTLTTHKSDNSKLEQYTVGTVPEAGTEYYVKIKLSRELATGERLTDGSGVDISPSSKVSATEYRVNHTINKSAVENIPHTYRVVTKYNTVSETVSIKRAYRTYHFMNALDEYAFIDAMNEATGDTPQTLLGSAGCVNVVEYANPTSNGEIGIASRSTTNVGTGDKYLYYLVPTAMSGSNNLEMVQVGQTGSIGKILGPTVRINGILHYIYKSNQPMGQHPNIQMLKKEVI